MINDTLISKQGPLGYVWLAANYDKKLTKHQLLNANIQDSTEFLVNSSISYQGNNIPTNQLSETPTTIPTTTTTITLRLSGQLLLGIVRIYSRKTKYLLDDVNDILLKLKTSFKYASGISLGGIDRSTLNNQITLNPKDTIISNVKSITLQDQVTHFDLLYQDDLNLDDDISVPNSNTTVENIGQLFSQALSQSQNQNQNQRQQDDSTTFEFDDDSIEYGRYAEPTTPGGHAIDLELDFELNDDDYGDALNYDDHSIEVGRNASQLDIDDNEISTLSINDKENTFDLGNPLETIDEPGLEVDDGSSTPQPEEANTPPPIPTITRPRQKRTGITSEGEIITNKRKLKIDTLEDLDGGISIQTLKDNQERLLASNPDYLTINLSESEKMQLIYELSAPPIPNKRRKLWNIDEQLQQRCLELSRQEEQRLEEQHNLQFDNGDYDDFNQDLDFDISLPDFGDNDDIDGDNNQFASQDDIEDDNNNNNNNNSSTIKGTTQVAEGIRGLLNDKPIIQLTDIIEKDLKISETDSEKNPLGTIYKHGVKEINMKREATKCFFELLVLATNDCIEMNQDNNTNTIGGSIDIRSRDKLYQNFI
ncbi:Rec8 like protein-domain-containing protein [Scheffersomyces amazonensis]|uniref:Rec8 like protein-domain-containing protein n=1 Tax=Scheffersomyces amazonensis TaxID=1078765 RepID=UPI00315CB8AA